jgi:serine/threonine-protein kinase
MNDAEKTTILAAAPGAYGYGHEDDWEAEEEEARRRRKRLIILLSVLGVLLLGGIIAAVVLLRGDEAPVAQRVEVPQLLNLDEEAARAALAQAGLEVGEVTTQPSSAEQKGLVINSDPASGASVEQGSTVGLVVGAGPDTLLVPNVVGLSEEEAVANLQAAGFTGNMNTREGDSLEPEGQIIALSPQQNSQAAPDTTFTLTVSSGTIALPDVANRSEGDARAALVEAGFSESQIATTNVERDDVAEGTVVGTSPGAGTPVGAGQTIELQVAVPTPPEPTPTTTTATTTPTTSESTSPEPTD